ncbi:BH3719 [Halalkalibacterium halodurans C-125]|uniref:BH3719 protein n=1 Tax=Halalkalibacterium halodurans (strain ATCC BAA-125 / DSM 18197 / FERM 7344 / JCM 9153 / C-125) TaxID=272558 RepID=Q9K6L0_HALH5|nr:BH3719 [Halalkalibacterium halodurans C-125]
MKRNAYHKKDRGVPATAT